MSARIFTLKIKVRLGIRSEADKAYIYVLQVFKRDLIMSATDLAISTTRAAR